MIIYKGSEYKTLRTDLYKIFPGIYGGNQHLGNKFLSMFGCGAVCLATFDSYISNIPLSTNKLKEKQQYIFNRYLLGPTSAYRFKFATYLYYRKLKKNSLNIKVRYNFTNNLKSIGKTFFNIKQSIDNDIPVPLIVGFKIKKGYENNLKSHWITVTGYSKDNKILVSNNGKMQFIDISKLVKYRLFIATIYIERKPKTYKI